MKRIFVDVTFNLITGKCFPFKKLNHQLFYVNAKSSHLPTIMRYNSSCNEKEYEKAKPFYETALNESEPKTITTCTKTTNTDNKNNARSIT